MATRFRARGSGRDSASVMVVWGALTLATATIAGGCAVTKPAAYNPERLGTQQSQKIGQICENVMGFKPRAEGIENQWPGDPDPESQTNDYRGCVASISLSVIRKAYAQREANGNRICRGKKLAPGSAALSECVLKYVENTPLSTSTVVANDLKVAPFNAEAGGDLGKPEVLRRQEQACAAIGLEPIGHQFDECMRGLSDVVTAQNLNQDYSN